MQTERTFIDDLKHQYNHGGMTMKLLFANTAVFLVIGLLHVVGRLGGGDFLSSISWLTHSIFQLPTDAYSFITHPWTLITSIFAHFGFLHFLLNMIFLYVVGRTFEQVLDGKRLFYTYLIGGIFGGIFEVLATFLPTIEAHTVVGASGGIMAIFIALAFYRPNMKVSFFGIFEMRIIFLGIAFFIIDFLSLGANDGTAHFAHLGGAVLGMISVQHIHSPGNIIAVAQRIGDATINFFKARKNKSPRMKVHRNQNARMRTDEEYNIAAKERQDQIDRILDKISKSGYDSLTKQEKDFLFKQSKNG